MSRDRRIALVSFDRPQPGSMVPFSYSAHKLKASLDSCAELVDAEVAIIATDGTDPEPVLEQVLAFEPTMVGITLYVWSLPPFRTLAEKLRQARPELCIVAGGPSARKSVFDLEPWYGLRDELDALVPGEGEEVIRELARHHLTGDWRERVKGLLLPVDGEWTLNGPVERPVVDRYPSPYHLGAAPSDTTGYIETFRGCPIRCSFCQWGATDLGGVHSVEHLRGHLEGLARADVENVFFLDAAFNLNPRAFRNLLEAEREVRALRDKVVFGHLYPTFVKDIHFELFELIGRVHPAIGVQSFVPEVLRKIGRPFDLQRFERVLDDLRGRVGLDIELMLGLPGDDPASFRETLHRAIEIGDSVRVSYTMVLPDALLDRARPEGGIDFDPESFLLRSCEGWTAESLEREWRYVNDLAADYHQQEIEETLVGFQIHERSRVTDPIGEGIPGDDRGSAAVSDAPVEVSSSSLPALTLARLRRKLAGAPFVLVAARRERGAIAIELEYQGRTIVLVAEPAVPGARHFVQVEDVDYSHRGSLDRADATILRRLIPRVHLALRDLLRDPEAPEPPKPLVQIRPKAESA